MTACTAHCCGSPMPDVHARLADGWKKFTMERTMVGGSGAGLLRLLLALAPAPAERASLGLASHSWCSFRLRQSAPPCPLRFTPKLRSPLTTCSSSIACEQNRGKATGSPPGCATECDTLARAWWTCARRLRPQQGGSRAAAAAAAAARRLRGASSCALSASSPGALEQGRVHSCFAFNRCNNNSLTARAKCAECPDVLCCS